MKTLTAIIHQENHWFVANNPETGVASQGKTEQEALDNLKEAVSLYLEEAKPLLQKVTVKPLLV
ncbi:MAG TPA: type II toxin-antitoxin system HicB family antitoxin [Candidatus Saccharimonadales bacterium]|nr:type II toxin-antitoxin system HicB family antitoxin [Candidatus Saccharimonadales bacterium]